MSERHRQGKNNCKDGGFTLIETLVVLTIFLLIFSLASSLFPHFMKNQETGQFLRQLSDDIHYAQAYAISHQQFIEVVIGASGETYHISKGVRMGKLYERKIPKDLVFKQGSMNLRIAFAPNGNSTSAGTWFIDSPLHSYKITFNIGKGRFRIEKL
ncbi:competence type IV pilus minor pilin ComGD [Bacillus sp. V59.32b]|uniref:competence type IV pilus minor pilin ComGD n=1 Tax=Bacillus sp. V59.32b TaxID=1758642 RepID=UPI000E3CBA56|nr:competence type IV pilus minor pilin ComGD [Bacillus sp. V59.32b]RFU61906.1 type II secretion system protein [Bacillus sp. V59.32b]